MLKLLPYTKPTKDLGEIMQALELKMSFAQLKPKTVARIHDWIKCRDFLGDVIYATETGKPFGIYGFKYDPATDIPIDKNNFNLLLKFPNKKMLDAFMGNMIIINDLCKKNKKKLPVVYNTQDELIIVLKSSKYWQLNIPLLSFYTFILKIMCVEYKDPMNWQEELPNLAPKSTERGYIKTTKPILDMLINKCYAIFKRCSITGVVGTADYEIHNYSGFISLCDTSSWMPNNTHREVLSVYKNRYEKAAKRAANQSKEMAEAVNAATEANCQCC